LQNSTGNERLYADDLLLTAESVKEPEENMRMWQWQGSLEKKVEGGSFSQFDRED